MSEPAILAASTAAGLVVAGVATGLQPELLMAGAAGGWWAMSYQDSIPAFKRASRIVISSLVAAWATPLAASFVDLPQAPALQLPVALVIGLATIDVLGLGVLSMVRRFIDRKGGGS